MKNHAKKNYKSAFTLAEVLITLAIVGVVSALTIPSVIIAYQKHQTVTKLKKAYSVIDRAIKLGMINSGSKCYKLKDAYGTDFFKTFLKPYLRVKDTCSSDDTPRCTISYGYLNNLETKSLSRGFILEDGTLIGVTCWIYTESCKDNCAIMVDIDGANKGANKFGIDVFKFSYTFNESPKLTSTGAQYSASYLKGKDASWNCNKERSGEACATLIMKQGWQITNDYPW